MGTLPEDRLAVAATLLAEAIALLEHQLPRLTSRKELAGRHLAALFLARATRLLRAMQALHDAGLDDTLGVAHRALAEQVILGLYVLFGGSEALYHVEGDHVRNVTNWIEANDIQELRGTGGGIEPARVSIEAIVRKLGLILTGVGDPKGLQVFYDSVYRGESTFSIHGAGAAHKYLAADHTTSWGVRVSPPATGGHALATALTAAMFTLLFGSHVLNVFGFSPDPGNEIAARIKSFLESAANIETA